MPWPDDDPYAELKTTTVARRPVLSPDGVDIRTKELCPAAPERASRRLMSPPVRPPGFGRVHGLRRCSGRMRWRRPGGRSR